MKRNQSLDALRGFAILTMVLSGSIAFGGVLPAWMYHAQVPPPSHKFVPTLAGITWVDLVFPFFLFSMGAAIPLSLQKIEREERPFQQVLFIAIRRFLLLAFFAFFTQHLKAWVLSADPQANDYLLTIGAFVLLCFQFYEYGEGPLKQAFDAFRILAFAIGAALLMFLPFHDNTGFDVKRVDIIILVLANMAFFGTLIWWWTRRQPWIRIGILPFIMGVFLSSNVGWTGLVYNATPFPWLYKFYFLKYLFIIIPGTFAGEWLLQFGRVGLQTEPDVRMRRFLSIAGVFALLIIVVNVSLLFVRALWQNLTASILLIALTYLFVKRAYKNAPSLMLRFMQAGAYLLLLGLCFEAYEGGVKKDVSTYSYYFITSGLAFFALIVLYAWQMQRFSAPIVNYLSLNGRNPMVAYVAGSLFLLPVLHLTGGIRLFDAMNSNAWIGFLRGILFTGIVSMITIFFVRMKWFWRT
jgi:predicted acyltransferase